MSRGFSPVPNDDPFTLDGLLEIPDLVNEPNSISQPFQPESNLFAFNFNFTEEKPQTLPELIPDFFALASNELFLELDSYAESTSASETGEAVSKEKSNWDDEVSEDIWSWKDVVTGTREKRLVNWDTFVTPQAENPRSVYLSEAGPSCFDAFLALQASQANTHLPRVVAQPTGFLRSVFELGIGRASPLYQYDLEVAKFVPTNEDFGISGISFELQKHVVQGFLGMGNAMRRLEAFVAESKSRPVSIAFSSAISEALFATKAVLQTSQTSDHSLLRLEGIFARPSCLVHALERLADVLGATDGEREAVVKFMHESEELSSCHTWLSQVLHEILQRISTPWISAIEGEVGLRPSPSVSQAKARQSFANHESREQISESNQETPLRSVEGLIGESRRCLEILREQQLDHPLLRPSLHLGSGLAWETSWERILQVHARANAYEQALKTAIMEYYKGNALEPEDKTSDTSDNLLRNDDGAFSITNLDTPHVLDRHLGGRSSLYESTLLQLTITALNPSIESSNFLNRAEMCPRLSHSLPLSLVPQLSAQSRLLSFSTLHLLFKTRSLRHHLSIQYRFQLLSDGLFPARLSRALFDPDQYTSEGRRTAEGTTGLRLQARDTWPPAGSELRLVLMGILNESYHANLCVKDRTNDELPGNLSFAIRELSAEDLEKCKDASSIEALDFLRLQYKPPPVLESIITPACLKKYDMIFKYLLRLLRLQSIAQSLLRGAAGKNRQVDHTTQKFRIDMQHFISTLAAYSNVDAIGVEWTRFQQLLHGVEDAIDRGDYEGTMARAGSLSRLERVHEEVLDRILRALFLDRRQAQVREVIEGIFVLVLRVFSKITRGNEREGDLDEVKSMYVDFKKQVGRLVRYLCSQGGSASSMGRKRLEESDGIILLSDEPPPFEHLLVKLDLFGYYS